MSDLKVIYEDNHIIAVNKSSSDIVQGDKTGDVPLVEKVKEYVKQKYNKPGEVFIGLAHRLDRPVSGIVLFARTSKCLTRLNDIFKNKEIKKIYWAIVKEKPLADSGELVHYLVRKESQNKSFAHDKEVPGSQLAILNYKVIARSDNYFLLEIDLKTGRHHQIRCQLSKIGCPIKGDLKYGFNRSNPNGGISLHAREILFTHPVKKKPFHLVAPPPDDNLWLEFLNQRKDQ